jgi:hypothetical protein
MCFGARGLEGFEGVFDLQESEGDVHHGCEDCLYALLELDTIGLSALLRFVF